MKVTKEESRPREVVLNIELEPAEVEPYLDRAYRRVVNKVSIPGFRKGKAPRAIVESFVGRDHLLHEALDFLIPESVERAVKRENLEAFLQPDVDVVELEPLSIKATVPLAPQVVLGDYQSLQLEAQPVEATDEQVQPVVERLRYESAPWEPVDRLVQFNDLVTLDVEGVVDGRSVASDKGIDYIPSKDNNLPLPGFSVYLEGMPKGGSKSFNLSVPEDYSDATISGKECRFQVKVHEVKQKVLPELDDEFAKGVGEGYETLQKMRETIQDNLTRAAQRDVAQELYERALQEVIRGAQVELSVLIIDREVDHLMQERARALQGRGMDMEGYLQTVGKSEEDVREELRPSATERLVRSLVLRKLAEEQEVKVTPEEVEREIREMTSRSGGADEAVKRVFSSQEGRSSVENALLTRKTLERLAEIVQGKVSSSEISIPDESTEGSDQGGSESGD